MVLVSYGNPVGLPNVTKLYILLNPIQRLHIVVEKLLKFHI